MYPIIQYALPKSKLRSVHKVGIIFPYACSVSVILSTVHGTNNTAAHTNPYNFVPKK